jgi:hypothetical protein
MPPPCLEASTVEAPKRGRPRKTGGCKPIAPYDSDPMPTLLNEFDRVTGESIRPEHLKTCAEALAQYHLSCEGKFANRQFLDQIGAGLSGATGIALISKEANRVGDSGEADPVQSAVEVFTGLANASDE